MTGWQRNTWSLFRIPFYMISYPLALLGAFQIWRNALSNERQTVGAQFPLEPQVVEEITTFVAAYLDEHPVE
jgi:hypothetical protein